MVHIVINNHQLFIDDQPIDLGHKVEQAEVHDGVLLVTLWTINMDKEQKRCNIWGLDPVTGKVLWQIQNRLLPGQDPNEIAPDPFTRFYVLKGYLKANTAIGLIYGLNAKDGTVEYLGFAK